MANSNLPRRIIKETQRLLSEPVSCNEFAGFGTQQNEVQVSVDPHVKVIARIRPPNSHEKGNYTVKNVSDDLVAIGDRRFSLDAVLDSKSSQEDAFQSVGAPMVKSAMAGYNTLVLAYGQAMMSNNLQFRPSSQWNCYPKSAI
ncbi:hypothetical protein E3N88_40532 [Mikania micrantha]|uniref:Kinesin motor domain-containing protein n=1 Tax=Mikania micrantha TaxID=192012 RepID=A0A5N6LMZ7_9ASTR|nr:hypothetical protein E3N88_40532 [Mikania micrantha]